MSGGSKVGKSTTTPQNLRWRSSFAVIGLLATAPIALATPGHGFGATGTFTLEVDGQTLIERTLDFVEAHLSGGSPIYGRFDVAR